MAPVARVAAVKRSVGFLARASSLFLNYKAAQVCIPVKRRLCRWNDAEVREAWHRQNDYGGREVRRMAEDFRGYYLKCGQWLGARPDLVPREWVDHLAPLQDSCPPMSLSEVEAVVSWDLLGGRPISDVFERFDADALGAASIAQVHSARLTADAARKATQKEVQKGRKPGRRKRYSREVVVKVQRPGAKELVLRDLATLHGFTKLVGHEVSWDVDMVMTEVMARVRCEFDFLGEARVQDSVADVLSRPPPHRRLSRRLARRPVAAAPFTLAAAAARRACSLCVGVAALGQFRKQPHAGPFGFELDPLGYRPPLTVPRSVPSLVAPSAFVMERVPGITLSAAARLGTGGDAPERSPDVVTAGESSRGAALGNGTHAGGSGVEENNSFANRPWRRRAAEARKRAILKQTVAALSEAMARTAFEGDGFVHGDPHPGNVMLNGPALALPLLRLQQQQQQQSEGSLLGKPAMQIVAAGAAALSNNVDVALVDWGQITTLSRERSEALARLIIAMTDANPARNSRCARDGTAAQLAMKSNRSGGTRETALSFATFETPFNEMSEVRSATDLRCNEMQRGWNIGNALEDLGLEFDAREEAKTMGQQQQRHGSRRKRHKGLLHRISATKKLGQPKNNLIGALNPHSASETGTVNVNSSSSTSHRTPWEYEMPLRVAAATALASHFFDTVPVRPPFEDHPLSENHPLRTLKVSTFPSDLFLFVRAVQIVKALSDETVAPSDNKDCWSLAGSWREHALGCLRERERERRRGLCC